MSSTTTQPAASVQLPTLALNGFAARVGTDKLYFDPVNQSIVPGASMGDRSDLMPLDDKSQFTKSQIALIEKIAKTKYGISNPFDTITPKQALRTVQRIIAAIPSDDPMRPVIMLALEDPDVKIVVVAQSNASAYKSENIGKTIDDDRVRTTSDGFAEKKTVYNIGYS